MIPKYLDKFDSLGLRRKGIYEPWETGIVKRELKVGNIFVDVGAHIGYYAVLASGLVGPSGHVYAFEPAPENYTVLLKNTIGATNVTACELAISSKAGLADFYLSPKSSGDNRLSCPPNGEFEKISIQTIRLDDFFADHSGIDFVKIDTQGHELSVLEGMKGILHGSKNLKMLIEYEPILLHVNGIEPRLLLEALKDYGFSISSSRTHNYKECTIKNRKHCNLYLRREG